MCVSHRGFEVFCKHITLLYRWINTYPIAISRSFADDSITKLPLNVKTSRSITDAWLNRPFFVFFVAFVYYNLFVGIVKVRPEMMNKESRR